MSYVGTVENGVVVLPPDAGLADGTQVRVQTVKNVKPAKGAAKPGRRSKPKTLWDAFRPFVGIVDGMPPDLAENHDHYIHGAPKRRKG